jgi:hypothetical protein
MRYREVTGGPVRVDDIQELGIVRNRALKLRQDVLAHLARAAAPAGQEPPPPTDDLILALLDLVIRHRDDTLARQRAGAGTRPPTTRTIRSNLDNARLTEVVHRAVAAEPVDCSAECPPNVGMTAHPVGRAPCDSSEHRRARSAA